MAPCTPNLAPSLYIYIVHMIWAYSKDLATTNLSYGCRPLD